VAVPIMSDYFHVF